MDTEYIIRVGNWIDGKVISQFGKICGKFKSHWNATNIGTGHFDDVHFENVLN